MSIRYYENQRVTMTLKSGAKLHTTMKDFTETDFSGLDIAVVEFDGDRAPPTREELEEFRERLTGLNGHTIGHRIIGDLLGKLGQPYDPDDETDELPSEIIYLAEQTDLFCEDQILFVTVMRELYDQTLETQEIVNQTNHEPGQIKSLLHSMEEKDLVESTDDGWEYVVR